MCIRDRPASSDKVGRSLVCSLQAGRACCTVDRGALENMSFQPSKTVERMKQSRKVCKYLHNSSICQFHSSMLPVLQQYAASITAVCCQYHSSMLLVSQQCTTSILSYCLYQVYCQYQQYAPIITAVYCQHYSSILPVSQQYVASIMAVCCQYHSSILQVSQQYAASVTTVYCQNHSSILPVPQHYTASITAVCCQYHSSILPVLSILTAYPLPRQYYSSTSRGYTAQCIRARYAQNTAYAPVQYFRSGSVECTVQRASISSPSPVH